MTSHARSTASSLAVGIQPETGRVGAYPFEKVEDANGEGNACGSTGMEDIARRSRSRLDLPAYLLVTAFQFL